MHCIYRFSAIEYLYVKQYRLNNFSQKFCNKSSKFTLLKKKYTIFTFVKISG